MVLISCKNCHKIYEKENYKEFTCNRCNHKVTKRVPNSFQISFALLICAMLLYIPAMIYPMMEITQLGVNVQSTILEGVISFLEMKSYFIAIVIFTASVVIPLIKLVGLFVIFISLKINIKMENKTKIIMYKFIEAIGKWSMIDIYVVAILSSIVQLDEIFNIKGGLAATSFGLMVILTMIAANKFDTRIIWDGK
ncbi:paraquat-inducible protein A [Aliarcobacter vitoriensis]|uniref:Paraquat-inducible protein A n=1 Tax=Aliarcobacter vitoriensis TaxID=2011099 RepID=A0A366MRU7_9BACT|nr:paraquat-inducible protein A [Aliarcobacter vitoriensis]RBQ29006.1 paraquat-inducible protein A [Aliarcobacter vitoriensis]